MVTIGVLSLQGNWREHLNILKQLDARVITVRTVLDMHACNGLIIPGGESTVMAALLERHAMTRPIAQAARAGFPLFGCCAGAILMAKNIENWEYAQIGAINISVVRNAYGRQIASFTAPITIFGVERRAVFIRAPQITQVGAGVQVLATHNSMPIVAQENQHIACVFHPEVVGWSDLHRYFIDTCVDHKKIFADFMQ